MGVIDDWLTLKQRLMPGKYRPVRCSETEIIFGYIQDADSLFEMYRRVDPYEYSYVARHTGDTFFWTTDPITALRLIADGLMEPANADSQED